MGSGPATILDGLLNGMAIDITAIDPLEKQYIEIYSLLGIIPLVKPSYGEVEKLPKIVSGKFFHLFAKCF